MINLVSFSKQEYRIVFLIQLKDTILKYSLKKNDIDTNKIDN